MFSRLAVILALLAFLAPPVTAQDTSESQRDINAFTQNRLRIVPPLFYRTAYSTAEQCTGITGDFDRIRWYIAHKILDTEVPEREYLGIWTQTTTAHEIVLKSTHAFHLTIVVHEILHDLFQGYFTPDIGNRCIPHWQILTPYPIRDSNEYSRS